MNDRFYGQIIIEREKELFISIIKWIIYAYHYTSIIPELNGMIFLTVIVSGVIFGAGSLLTIEALSYVHGFAGRVRLSSTIKAPLGGCVLVVMALALSTQYMGLGVGLIERSLQGGPVNLYALLAKIAFTSITLGFGGSGGVITPIFAIGATLGAAFAQVCGLSVPMFAAIGLASVLLGTTKTPIASSIMDIELFGPYIGPYAAVACIISFIVSGPRSVYPSQVFSLNKLI